MDHYLIIMQKCKTLYIHELLARYLNYPQKYFYYATVCGGRGLETSAVLSVCKSLYLYITLTTKLLWGELTAQ